MSKFYLTVTASANYLVDVPTLQILVAGVVVSSVPVPAHTGTSTNSFTFLLDFPTGTAPSSVSVKFSDALTEAGRGLSISNLSINGQLVNTATDLTSTFLANNQAGILNIVNTGHLFGRFDPTQANLGTATIVGTAGADVLSSTNGADIINGAGGNDFLRGIGGNDSINGGTGNDTIFGEGGNDIIIGGLGNDTIFGNAGNDLLYGGDGNDFIIGGTGNDVISGGLGIDTLTGGAGNDIIFGEAGNDTITGGAGDDYLYGDAGIDTITGGAGIDTIYGGTGNDTLLGDAGNDIIYGESGNNFIMGGTGNDTITGGTGIDTVYGGTGNDTISGGLSNDLLFGDAGNDTINGDAGNDMLIGGLGADTLNGGAGNDIIYGLGIDAAASSAIVRNNLGITFDQGTNSFYKVITGPVNYATANAAAQGTLINGVAGHLVTINSLVENTFIQTLAGGASIWMGGSDSGVEGNWQWQGAAENGVEFWAGNALGVATNNLYTNWMAGQADNAGAGQDNIIMDVTGAWSDVVGTLNYAYIIEWEAPAFSFDTSSDILNGGTGNDTLYASSGNTTLNGDAGNDQLFGGTGNDILAGGAGNDYINGGLGNDTVDYSTATAAVTVNLSTNTVAADGFGGLDTIFSIESLMGSTLADSLTGDANANTINGNAGNDIINGFGGTNTLIGGAGNDTITGGAGIDTVDYSGAAGAVNANVASGTTVGGDGNGGTDTFTAIENLTGSAFADTLTGNLLANVLNGGAGNDTLIGGAGNDTLNGGAGINTADYSAALAGVTANLGLKTASIDGDGGIDTFTSINNLTGSAFADTLTGDNLANTLTGNAGNDALFGGAGNDILNGGAGIDTANYTTAAGAVTANLTTGTTGAGLDGNGGTDTFTLIENLTGSAFADTLTGNTLNNTINGNAGNDTINGVGGTNILNGGLGNDIITGGTGNDTIHGGTGNDTLIGTAGNNTLIGGAGNDTFTGGTGIDTVDYTGAGSAVTANLATGTTGIGLDGDGGTDTFTGAINNINGSIYADTLTGDLLNNNTINGNAGNDIINGTGGVNILNGDLGNDTITGGTGVDTISGGIGSDVLTGGAGNDIIYALDNGISTITADVLFSNTINGGAGADTIYGSTGIDILNGDAGNDFIYSASDAAGNVTTLNGGNGLDSLFGSNGGMDSFNFESTTAFLNIDLIYNYATADGDMIDLTSVLNGFYVPAINTLSNFVQITTVGADSLLWVDTTGSATFGAATQIATIVGVTGLTNVTALEASGNLIVPLDNFDIIGTPAPDVLIGTAANNRIGALASDDLIYGAGGNDILYGMAGSDTATYSAAAGAVNASLLAGGTTAGGDGDGGTDTYNSIENLTGSAFADTLTGDAGANVLSGLAGNDVITGGAGNDTLMGGAGNDTLNGGTGINTVSYKDAAGAVTATITATNGGTTVGGDGDGGTDTFTSIANLTGSAFADNLTGDLNANVLSGGAGNDTLIGLAGNDTLNGDAGNDTLIGGLGNDALNGGAGSDTADYSGAAGAVNVNLATGGINGTGGTATGMDGDGGTDTFTSIENINGSAFNDILAGNSAANIINGNAGIDFLSGGGGVDTLNGGAGNDTVDYTNAASNVIADISLGTASNDGDGSNDILIGIENITGSNFDDTLTGDLNANIIKGQSGADTVNAGAGDDMIYGGLGNDILNGDAGNDLIIGGFGSDTINGGTGNDNLYGQGIDAAAVAAVLAANPGLVYSDQTNSFYQLVTGAFDYNAAAVNADAIVINGVNGHLASITSAVENTFVQNLAAGNAAWLGGTDTTVEGEWRWTSPVEDGAQFWSGNGTTGSAANSMYSNWAAGMPDALTTLDDKMQMLSTGQWQDLNGKTNTSGYIVEWEASAMLDDSAADIISGGAGNDYIYGFGGNDNLNGDDGIDHIYGGAGNDTMSGGLGDDILIDSTGNNIFNGDDGNDILDARWVSGTPSLAAQANDIITDYMLANPTGPQLFWSADTTNFYQYFDQTVLGTGGWDYVTSAANSTASMLNGVAGHLATVTSRAENTFLKNFDLINGNDQWLGANDVTTEGTWVWGAGPEAGSTFWAGGPTGAAVGGMFNSWKTGKEPKINTQKNFLILKNDGMWKGKDGVKFRDYATEWESATLLVTPPTPPVQGFNTMHGGNGNDTVYGGNGNDLIYGDAGNDTLYGFDGADTIDGGTGIDTLYGGNGNDILTGGTGDDILYGDAGVDTLYGGTGIDTLYGGDGNDTLNGDDGNDMLYGGIGGDTINGGLGNDTIYALDNGVSAADADKLFSNTIDGGAGNDIIYGSTGSDMLIGGAGADVINSGSVLPITWQQVEALYGVTYNATTGNFYKMSTGMVDWTTGVANSKASLVEGIAGHMVTLTSNTEQNWVDATLNAAGNDIWAGATDVAVDGTWQWATGPEAGLTFWTGGPTANGGVPVGGLWNDWDLNGGEPGFSLYKNHLLITAGGTGNSWVIEVGGTPLFNVTEWEGSSILLPGNITTLDGGLGADILNGGLGTDHFMFKAASAFDAIDTVNNFATVQSDALDISDILTGGGYSFGVDLITNWVSMTTVGADTVVKVDATGTGAFGLGTQIATVAGVVGLTNVTLLETNGTLITH